MNETNQASKDAVMKTLAIIGFVAAIVFAVWLAVKIVSVIPDTFSSLASIADGVYNTRPQSTITIATSKSVVNDGESFTVSWTSLDRPGNYTFTYACTDGVALDVRTSEGIISLDCDTPLNLAADTERIDVTAASQKRRFTDIDYTVSFTEAGASTALSRQTGTFTVVNASIPQSSVAQSDTSENEQSGEVAGESTTEPEPTTPNTPSTPVTPGEPTVIETPIYAIPTSDPNGFADLAVRFISVGVMDNNKNFIPTNTIDNDTRGAFRFEVLNLGTKTSEEWEFEATFTSGATHKSGDQAPLKPNERSIITLGFDAVGETGVSTFGAEITGGDDINTNNNSFTWAVRVTD